MFTLFTFTFNLDDGTSTYPCSDVYGGSSGNPELEMQALTAKITELGGSNFHAFIDFHTIAYMWLFPWGNSIDFGGYECQFADDHDELVSFSKRQQPVDIAEGANFLVIFLV